MKTEKEKLKHSDERIQKDIDLQFGRFRFTFINRHPVRGYKFGIFKCNLHGNVFDRQICSFKKEEFKTKPCPCLKIRTSNKKEISYYQERIDRCYPNAKGQYEILGRKDSSPYSVLVVKCHKPVILAITSLSKILSPKYLRLSL